MSRPAPHRSTRRNAGSQRRRRRTGPSPGVTLLSRRPLRGRVKTRLAEHFGAPLALALHEAFLLDTLAWLRALRRQGWRVGVEWSEPFRPRGVLRQALRGLACGVQARGGLGRRIEMALRGTLRRGCSCAVAIGSDSPHLGAMPLRRALRSLERCDAVLGPARDGGYYLIGLRQLRRRWFEGIDWGTSKVLGQSLTRLRADGLRVALLDPAADLDTPESLRELQGAMVRSAALRRRLRFTGRILHQLSRQTRSGQCRAQR
ncbi:MAG: TIGR04282 family arsenosugar biosynthesis glycosyltransferase [Acidobacteriota bacterium]